MLRTVGLLSCSAGLHSPRTLRPRLANFHLPFLCARFSSFAKEPVLETSPTKFKGLTIREGSVPADADVLDRSLNHAIQIWRNAGNQGVWLKISKEKSHLIPTCLKHGFEFHHTSPDYIMLSKWLPLNEASRLPKFSDHSIGCGGAVMNDKNEILLITESHTPHQWKIPGGLLNTGEEIPAAAIREVFEETGIESKFESLLAFRHTHNALFGSGNIYAICLLRATTHKINLDPVEIAKCRWAPLEEFCNMKDIPPIQQAVAKLVKEYLHEGKIGWKSTNIWNTVTGVDSLLFNGADKLDFTELSSKMQRPQHK